MTFLIIICWIAIAMIYLLQFQIVRDYKPHRVEMFWEAKYGGDDKYHGYTTCYLERESIFKIDLLKLGTALCALTAFLILINWLLK